MIAVTSVDPSFEDEDFSNYYHDSGVVIWKGTYFEVQGLEFFMDPNEKEWTQWIWYGGSQFLDKMPEDTKRSEIEFWSTKPRCDTTKNIILLIFFITLVWCKKIKYYSAPPVEALKFVLHKIKDTTSEDRTWGIHCQVQRAKAIWLWPGGPVVSG